MNASKKTAVIPDRQELETPWQPIERRHTMSDEAKRWAEDNAEAAVAWAKWVLENGVPLAKYSIW